MIHTLDNLLAGHTVHVLAAFCLLALVGACRAAMGAYRDVARLDVEQQGMRERLMQPLLSRVRPTGEVAIRKLRLELMQAGIRREDAIERYTMGRAVGLIAAAVLTVLLAVAGNGPLQVLVTGAILLYIGYFGPDVYISRKKSDRQGRLGRSLPPMIDLMVLCLDVGLSIESSFERVAMEMRSMEPLMAEEAGIMVSEMGAGLTFPQALKRMSDRIGLDDLTVLSRLISQAATLGASVTNTLREYSDAAFQKRVLGLEEKAGKLSSQMVLPITVCMLPAVMIALVGPAGIMLVEAFKSV